MYYVLNIDRFADYMDVKYNLDDKGIERIWNKIIKEGFGKFFDGNYYIISKSNAFKIEDYLVDCSYPLEQFITNFDGGECITLIEGLQIGIDDVIDVLTGELYEPCNDEGTTYADRIYNAENPYDEVDKLINEFLLIAIDFKMSEIKLRISQIRKEVEDGKIEWE